VLHYAKQTDEDDDAKHHIKQAKNRHQPFIMHYYYFQFLLTIFLA